MKKLMRGLLWFVVIMWICFFTYELFVIIGHASKQQDIEAREHYEATKAIVLVQFEVPKEHKLHINGTETGHRLYMSSRKQYKVELYKDGEVIRTFYFKPKGPLEIEGGREVIKL